MKRDFSAIKAIVAILLIVIITFIVIRAYSKTAQENTEITGNVVYDWHDRPPDQSVRTDRVGFYENTGGNKQVNAYGVDYDTTEWDSKRPALTESRWGTRPKYVDRQGGFNYNYYPTNTDQQNVLDHKPSGKVYLKRTYLMYIEQGEINFVIELEDKEGIERVTYDVYNFEPGYGQNQISKKGRFSLLCEGKTTCNKSYIFARNVKNFYQIFEPYTVNFFYRDSKGNIREGVLNAENNWIFEFT